MDPVNQSAQISSSGFADGQNSAAKESKLSGKTKKVYATVMLVNNALLVNRFCIQAH